MTSPAPRDEERGPAIDEPESQWARGGAMSNQAPVAYEPKDAPPASAARPSTGASLRRERSRWSALPALAVLAAAGVFTWIAVDRVDDDDLERASTSSAPAVSSIDSPPDQQLRREVTAGSTESSIGEINWTRSRGDRSTLPAGIVGWSDFGLVGRGDDGELGWTSLDGADWQLGVENLEFEAGGRRWSVVSDDGHRRLVEVTDTGRVLTSIAVPADSRDGTAVSWEVPAGPAGVIGIGGEVFARLDRRDEVPWHTVLGIGPSESYRVRITDGADVVLIASSTDSTARTVELAARLDRDRIVLDDEAGVTVWSALTSATSPLDALQPLVSSEWLRWDGLQFAPADRPWAPTDRVEVVAVEQGLMAAATISLDGGARVWFTPDGLQWAPVEPPATPSPASPMPIAARDGDVILTISDGTLTSHWSTADATTFERLADVPGINERSRASFGWIAPDPRSSPRLRVSADGVAWETIDLSAYLGFDASRWDATVDATAIGSSIYVVATIGDERTLLRGTVAPIQQDP